MKIGRVATFAASVVLTFLLATPAEAGFTKGPSVRVIPGAPYGKVEIAWSADFVGDGKVSLFDHPDASGAPVANNTSSGIGNDHLLDFNIGGVVRPDTTYYFQITHRDSNGNLPDLITPIPLQPLFTGTQVIEDVIVNPSVNTASLQWSANVIGHGRVEYGISSLNEGRVDDPTNAARHEVELNGLLPGTIYQYRVSTRHAIDGDVLAERTGSFRTPSVHSLFTKGPSVRVIPGAPFGKLQIAWSAGFVGDGICELFDAGDGSGTLIDGKETGGSANDQSVDFNIGGLVRPDTKYYFKITHRDPNGAAPDLVTPIPMQSLFTGVQSIGDVFVQTGTNTASLLWNANLIGVGRVEYGIGSLEEASVDDGFNVRDHQLELTGLVPGTTYHYRVSNRHAIDGDALAEKSGSFRTLPSMPDAVDAIAGLRDFVATLGLPRGMTTSLQAKLSAALEAAEAGDTSSACAALQDFLNEVRAQAGKKLTAAQADDLTNRATDLRARLGC